jgi:hypothetical protein
MLVVELDPPSFTTTNHDANLEKSYACNHPLVKITGAADMAAARPGVTQIVNHHGDFSNPDTLVLPESDYFDRLAFDAPLDINFEEISLGDFLKALLAEAQQPGTECAKAADRPLWHPKCRQHAAEGDYRIHVQSLLQPTP